jgi:SAM-dependent methyltransferase
MDSGSPETTTGSAPTQGELWGTAVRDWAALQEPQHLPLHEEAIRRTGVDADTALLDVGCGSGGLCRLAAARGARVFGIDAAARLVDVARERVPEGEFEVGDLQFLPYPDDRFDVVTGINSVQYAADPEAAIREAGRVTRAGGAIFLLVWGREEHTELVAMLRAFGSLLPAAPPDAPGPFSLSYEGTLDGLVTRAGLTTRDAGYFDATFDYQDEDAMLRGLTAGGPAVLASRAAGPAAVRDALSSALAPYRTDSGRYRIETEWRYVLATSP